MSTMRKKPKKISTMAAIGAAVTGLGQMSKRGSQTTGQKVAAARKKKRVTGVPKVTRRRAKKAGI